MIREVIWTDWSAIGPIFSDITRVSDTYAYFLATHIVTAESSQMKKPNRIFVFEEGSEILGTYCLKTKEEER